MYNLVSQDALKAKDSKQKLAKKNERFLKLLYNGEVKKVNISLDVTRT